VEAEPTWTFLRRSNGDVDNRLLPDGEAASLLLGEPEASRGVDVRSTRSCLGDGITPFVASRALSQLQKSRRAGVLGENSVASSHPRNARTPACARPTNRPLAVREDGGV
jgi:hypothetical protein